MGSPFTTSAFHKLKSVSLPFQESIQWSEEIHLELLFLTHVVLLELHLTRQ